MKTKERHFNKMKTIHELNEYNNNIINQVTNLNYNNNNNESNTNKNPTHLNISNKNENLTKENNKTNKQLDKKESMQTNSQNLFNNLPNKDQTEFLVQSNKRKSTALKESIFPSNLSNNFSSSYMNKNLDDNKSIYSTSKKGEASVYSKFNNKGKNLTNNEKSNFGDSFDAGKQSLKEIMENASKEVKIFNLIDDTINFLNGDKFILSNTKEEKDKYEMIEKNNFQKMKENNLEYKQKKIQLTENYNNLVKHVNQISKRIIGLKNSYNDQEKNKEDTKNQIYYQENELKELNIQNEKIHEMVLENRMKKNNIVKALVLVCKKHQDKIPKNKKKIFETFYNQNFEDFLQLKNVEKIRSLKDKIAKLEEEVKAKNKECENVKNLLEKK